MNFFKKLGASIKEFFRKKVVSLKRNPKLVPLVILLFGFVYYSLNITAISETTLQLQLPGNSSPPPRPAAPWHLPGV